VSFEVPEYLAQLIGAAPETLSDEARLAAAMHWYGRELITLGQAAEVAGMSQAQFMGALKAAKQNTFNIDIDELRQELAYIAEHVHPVDRTSRPTVSDGCSGY
jgi:predicted HTH domain antitoxin